MEEKELVITSRKNWQPTKTMISYGFGKFLAEFFTQAFATTAFFYYEKMLGLDSILCTIAFILYSIWNAVNDPLIGFFTNKPTRFARKLGRRYPWIVFGTVSSVLAYILIYAVPHLDPVKDKWILFTWMVISTCLYDTLYSTWEVNYQSVFPDKFRSEGERSKTAGLGTLIGIFGIALGSLLPTLIINYDDPSSFLSTAVIFAGIGILIAALMMHGVKETPYMIERYLIEVEEHKKLEESGEIESNSFLKDAKQTFKHKNFVAFILLFFFYQSAMITITGSINYTVLYVLGRKASAATFLLGGFLVGCLISLPFWIKIAQRVNNNQKLIQIGAIWMAVISTIMYFFQSYIVYIILMVIWGMGLGLFWMIMTPCLADVIDEVVVKTGKRNDGIFMGLRAFFGRLSYAVQAIVFGLVHVLTHFDNTPGVTSQPLDAVWGIRFHLTLIPALLLIVGVLVFQKLNTLTPEKMTKIRAKLTEMKL
ncbi:MAG: MFS transporter [Promethearchaeota archaeon]